MHSRYCDGKGELIDYVRQAMDHDLFSIGFSSHAPVPFPSVWCMKAALLDDYLNEINTIAKAAPTLEIYKGLEVDFIPGAIKPGDFASRLDYTIGSIHFVDKFANGNHWEIDGLHTVFLDGLEKIFGGRIKDAITRYYELTREMIETSCPTIIGHLDKIKIHNLENKFYREDDNWYQAEIDKTIDVISQSGAIVEVNTRGLYQGKSTTPYPSPWILQKLLKKHVPITLSSDAHHPSDIINRFSEMVTLLFDIGFKSISILSEGQWKPYPFDAHGIIR